MTYRPPVLLLCLLLAACGRSGDADDAAPATGTASALVTLATAERGAVAQTITVYGQVEAGSDSQRMLAAPVEALVAAIEAPAGSHVRQGQRIVRLQPSPATRAQWQSAVAEAQAAREALARTQRLRADGLIARKVAGYGLRDCLRITIGPEDEMARVGHVLTGLERKSGAA